MYLRALVFIFVVAVAAGRLGPFSFLTPAVGPVVKKTVVQVANWSLWSEFSICTASCGGGIKLRRRECLVRQVYSKTYAPGLSVCAGSSVDIALCNTHQCKIAGHWAEWSVATPCCSGIKIRHRTCTNPIPVNSPECKGDAVETTVCGKGEIDLCGCPQSCAPKKPHFLPVEHKKSPAKKHEGYGNVKTGLVRVPNKG